MVKFRLSITAEEDLIRIYHYGVHQFGIVQADKYYLSFFECFEKIALNPFSFESVSYIKVDYRRCVCGLDSIYYTINGPFVEIMTIVGRQDLKQISL